MTHLQNVIIVSHTHWDREWYRTFQCFRFRFVDVMDRLLDFLLQHSGYAHFLLDGQTLLLEDYLALRPERTQDVRLLVEGGRLGIGPWYVQPDEFLSSGEALIRNLLLGHQVAHDLGGSIKVGWLPDTFGHIGQLPQILRGFDIDTFVFSRGLGDHLEEPVLEFWWQAPDGSRVLGLFQKGGYWNAGCLGYPYFWGDVHRRLPDPELALERVERLVAELRPWSSTPTVAIWNGADHLPLQESIPDLVSHLNEQLTEYTVRHGRVEDYASAVREAAPELPTIRGELRGSRYQNLLASTLSSRIHLKQANHRVQSFLEHYAEPLAALAWLVGDFYPHRRLWEAWRLLLQNHPHDSICGCSIDQVHREMLPRFQQAQQIATCAANSAFDTLTRQVDMSWCPSGCVPLVVFNPLAQERREVLEIALRLSHQQQAYRAVDHEGTPSQVEILSQDVKPYSWMSRKVTASEFSEQFPFWRQCLREMDGLDIAGYEWKTGEDALTLCLHLAEVPLGSDQVVEQLRAEAACRPSGVRIEIEASYVLVNLALLTDLPPCGYAAYAIEATGEPPEGDAPKGDGHRLENEHLRIEVSPHGWLTVVDKHTQRSFVDLHQIEDSADRGDCYDFSPLPNPDDGPVTPEDGPEIRMLGESHLVQSLEIRHRLRVPLSLVEGGERRSVEQVDLPMMTVLNLRAGAHYLEILTKLDNRARDHRLRVLFPTGIDSDVVHADGHFAVATRQTNPTPAGEWHQPSPDAQPHHTWFGTDDGQAGLAILSEGLPEHAGLCHEDGLALALTLLRSVGWLSRGDLSTREGDSGPAKRTPEAQCLGHHSFRYGVLPYRVDPVTAGVHRHAAAFEVPPLARCVAAQRGQLPPRQSIVSLQPQSLVLSALKRSERDDRLLVRFYNVSPSPVEAEIRFGFCVAKGYRATVGENILEPLEFSSDGFRCQLKVGPAEIVTLLVNPKESGRWR